MRAIVRNCVHGSDIVIMIETGREHSVVVKSSTSQSGIPELDAEIAGLTWYSARRDRPIHWRSRSRLPHYIAVEREFIVGRVADYHRGPAHAWPDIKRAIDHYIDIWSGQDLDCAVTHGDLSLDNVMMLQDEVVIIDWEHFTPAGLPIGFDALYLLFECTWFAWRSSGHVSDRIASLLKGAVVRLRDRSCLNARFLERPLSEVISLINERPELWGGQLTRFRNKLPILQWTAEETAAIDTQITRASAAAW